MQSEDALIELARTDRSFFQEVYAQFRRFIARLQEKMPDKRELMKLESLFAKAAKASNIATQTQKSPADGSGVQYSIKNTMTMPLTEQLRKYYKGELKSSDSLYFGETPLSITDDVLKEGSLAMPTSVLKKSTKEKHNVPRRVLKSLQNDLKNAWFSFEKDSQYGFVVPDVDGDGKPLLIAIDANGVMDRKRVNVITSVYGLDNPTEWLSNQIADKKRYKVYNKEKADSFLQTYGYLALVEDGIDSSNAIIPDSTPKSNPQFYLPSQSALQVPSQGGDGGVGSTDTQDGEAPRKPRLTKSQYIKRMLEDPSVGEATKARIRADDPLYEVLSDKVRAERASELAANEDAILAIAQKLENGEATTAEEITALTLVQAMSADGDAQAHAVYVTAMAARRAVFFESTIQNTNKKRHPYGCLFLLVGEH